MSVPPCLTVSFHCTHVFPGVTPQGDYDSPCDAAAHFSTTPDWIQAAACTYSSAHSIPVHIHGQPHACRNCTTCGELLPPLLCLVQYIGPHGRQVLLPPSCSCCTGMYGAGTCCAAVWSLRHLLVVKGIQIIESGGRATHAQHTPGQQRCLQPCCYRVVIVKNQRLVLSVVFA